MEAAIAKLNYSHEAMADLIIAEPGISQGQIAAKFGYTPAWVCRVLATDAFQAFLAARKDTIVDPTLRATVEERFRALVLRSQEILMEKLNAPTAAIPDNVALKALELGAKACEIGGFGRVQITTPPPPPPDRLEHLAARLIELQANVRKGQVYENAEIIAESGPLAA